MGSTERQSIKGWREGQKWGKTHSLWQLQHGCCGWIFCGDLKRDEIDDDGRRENRDICR